MSALVHASSRLTGSPGVVLVSHSITEDNNGLITVACEYVCTAQRLADTDLLFYPDAPPPIYPDSVNRRYLLAQKLFMGNRDISVANGLATIKATYVSGLARSGKHARISISKESAISLYIPLAIGGNEDARIILAAVYFTYIPTIVEHEYVIVGSEKSGDIAAPTNDQLYTLVSYGGFGVGVYPQEYAVNFLNSRARAIDEQSAMLAPSVLLKTTQYFIEEYNPSQ